MKEDTTVLSATVLVTKILSLLYLVLVRIFLYFFASANNHGYISICS